MAPLRRAIMEGNEYRQTKNVPVRFTSSTRCQSAREVS